MSSCTCLVPLWPRLSRSIDFSGVSGTMSPEKNPSHDIWKGLVPLPIRALFTRSNEIHRCNTMHAAKGNYLWKEVKLENFKCSCSRTGAILWNQISTNWRDVSKPIFKKNL